MNEVAAVVVVVEDVSAEVATECEEEDCEDVDGRFEVLMPDGIGGDDAAGITLLNALLSSRAGKVEDNADVGRKASPLLGEAGRTGDGGLIRTGESGRDEVAAGVEGEGDCPLPRLGETLALAVCAETADEDEEGNIPEGGARIVGEGRRAFEAAEGGLVVMLFEWCRGGLTGSAPPREDDKSPSALPVVLDRTPDMGLTRGILGAPSEVEGLDERG